jgi:hypothetical protein
MGFSGILHHIANCHDIAEIVLKVALNSINLILTPLLLGEKSMH